MLKPNKPRVSALAGHLLEKQRYRRSFIAGKYIFKNKMIVSAKIKDEALMQNFSSLFDIIYAFDSARE